MSLRQPRDTFDYAPAMYTERSTLRWWLRMLRFKIKHGAKLRGTWAEAQWTRRIQKAMPK